MGLKECSVLFSLHLEDLGSLMACAQRFTLKGLVSALFFPASIPIIEEVSHVKCSYRESQQRWIRFCESAVGVVNNSNDDITSTHASLAHKVENNISVFLLQAKAADCCMARDSSVVFCGLGGNVEEVLSLNVISCILIMKVWHLCRFWAKVMGHVQLWSHTL